MALAILSLEQDGATNRDSKKNKHKKRLIGRWFYKVFRNTFNKCIKIAFISLILF